MVTFYDIDELQRENSRLKMYLRKTIQLMLDETYDDDRIVRYLEETKLIVVSDITHLYEINEEMFE